MKYLGSKAKIANEIWDLIHKELSESGFNTYIEPFCGGCNVMNGVVCRQRIASDKQYYLIELFKNRDKVEYLDDVIDKEHYDAVRKSYYAKDGAFEDWYIGAIGFLGSTNGRFFDGGYAKPELQKNGKFRNIFKGAKNGFVDQVASLYGTEFYHRDYTYYTPENTKNAVIYCDIPYLGTKAYSSDFKFDHAKFWEWVKGMSKDNVVLVSEYTAPDEFTCIWQTELLQGVNYTNKTVVVEKVFKYLGE